MAFTIIKAVMAHLYLAWIHPFGDGNGRTARLLEFRIMLGAGAPSPAAHLLSNHYNLTRSDYYRYLDQARQHEKGVIAFLEYAARGLVDGLREEIQLISQQHMDVAWRSYVQERTREGKGKAAQRRRDLLLDLSTLEEAIPLSDLPGISRRVAKHYMHMSDKTLSRDFAYLIKGGLVELQANSVRAKKEVILAFLPVRRGPTQRQHEDSS